MIKESAEDKRLEPTPRRLPPGRTPDRDLSPGASLQDFAQGDGIRKGVGPVDNLAHPLNWLLQRHRENGVAEVHLRIGIGRADANCHVRRDDPELLLGAAVLLDPLEATLDLDPDLLRRRSGRHIFLLRRQRRKREPKE